MTKKTIPSATVLIQSHQRLRQLLSSDSRTDFLTFLTKIHKSAGVVRSVIRCTQTPNPRRSAIKRSLRLSPSRSHRNISQMVSAQKSMAML